MNPDLESIPYSKLVEVAQKVAIRDKNRVLKEIKEDPKANKKSWGKWDKYPRDYTKQINDPKYPTALRCDYIPELKLHLGIIDLDIPKKDKPLHIPIEKLKSKAGKIIESTYSVQTPSGGYQIYLLSRNNPTEREPATLNIDYQVNKSDTKGKYCITDYRWNKEGKKEYYRKLGESPKEILIVHSIDKIFKAFLEDLTKAGYIKTPQNEHTEDIANLFKPYIENRTSVNNFSLAIAGYLRKQGFTESITTNIIKLIFKDKGDIHTRIGNVKQTYERPIKEIEGWQHLKDVLGKEDKVKLDELTKNGTTDLRDKIATKLMRHKYPSPQEIADLINGECDFYINPETRIYYEKIEDGSFKEINHYRIVDYTNEIFGPNQISEEIQKKSMSQITKKVKKDYNLIEFTNGLLNTKTKEFKTDKSNLNSIPKIVIPFKWNPDAKGGYIQKVFKEILDYNKNPVNMELWLRMIGHFFMGWNSLEKIMIVVGPSRSGKSTLSTALERIFNVSRIPTQKIVKNERFALIDMIDKDLNIDDDINNGVLKGIGFLNTLISGKTIPVEKKGVNEPIILQNQQIPRLIANGNSLPPVIGEGWGTRLVLIKAPNKRPIDKRDETLHSMIQQGEYDSELEWLVYTAITTYWDNKDKPLINQELEDEQTREYQFQSYPLLVAIESLFKKDWDTRELIPVKDVNKYLQMWSEWAYKEGKISKEHRRPTTTQIKKAMDNAGFHSKTVSYKEDDGYTTQWEYVDIKQRLINPEDNKQTTLVSYIIGELEKKEEK